jgi:hypothetical protein
MSGEDDLERLGDLLIEEGIVTYEEAVEALKASGKSNSPVGRLLVQANPVRRKELASFLAMDADVPYLDLAKVEITRHEPQYIPEGVARKHECVPLDRIQNILCVAKANVMNRAAVIEIRKMTGLKVKVFKADEDKVLSALDVVYGPPGRKPAATRPAAPAIRVAATTPSSVPLPAVSVSANEVTALTSGEPAEVQRIVEAWEKRHANTRPIPADRVA